MLGVLEEKMYKYQLTIIDVPREYFPRDELSFKVMEFPNPIAKGDEVKIGDYNFGLVINLLHDFEKGITLLAVDADKGPDTHFFFGKYNRKESGLEEMVEVK